MNKLIEQLKDIIKTYEYDESRNTEFSRGRLDAFRTILPEIKKLTVIHSSLLLNEDYKKGFDEWKIRNGYKKDIKHKCYFKGDKAYFDFNLIEEYDKEIKSNL